MAVLKTVQSGTVSFATGDVSKTATITAVTTASSIVYFSFTGNTSAQTIFNQVKAELTNTTTLTFTRADNSGVIGLNWYVVEFTSGVTVQRGLSSDIGTTTNITVSTASLTTSWSILSIEINGYSNEYGYYVSHYLSTTTNLLLTHSALDVGEAINVNWQVITYDNASVQSISKAFLTTDTSITSTITSVTQNRTFLEFSYTDTTSGSVAPQHVWNSYLTNATTVTYSRNAGFFAGTARLYAISLSDSVSVQRGEKALAALSTTNALTTIVVANAFANAPSSYGRSKNDDTNTTSWNSHITGVRLALTSTTVITFTRATNAGTVTIPWEVVEWLATTTTAAKPIFNVMWFLC